MSENTTLARPYANAVFMFAIEHKSLELWSSRLNLLSAIVQNKYAASFISNPDVGVSMQAELILSTLIELDKCTSDQSLINWIALLSQNKRLGLLPAIAAYFDGLLAEYEKTLTVYVSSFGPISTEQQKLLTQRLSDKLQRKVKLSISIDPLLMGGAIIYAGDWVLDNTVRGKLTLLKSHLAA